jgi:LacI family transcriptional regulator, repressor for deo operon, udp, cdd, tsx, nupC, and nupG
MPISIKDVARAAQVSYSTVSRALADSPRVKPETRLRIQRLAAEMGYFPSFAARSLVTQRTQTIGLVATTIMDLFQAEIIQVVEETALQHGYSVILSHSGKDSEREQTELRALRERHVDGIILISVRSDGHYASAVRGTNIPVVFLNNVRHDECGCAVCVDNLAGGRVVTEHLLALGHRRIGYITGPIVEWDNTERHKGYEQALRARGVAPDPEWVVRGDSSSRSGTDAMRRLLALPRPPTAVFCYNDASALGAMRATHAAGLRIPEDISIAGFDDIDLAAHFEPPLTTVAQPKLDMGVRAVEMILTLLRGEGPVEDSVLPGRLVIRESTGASPA